MRQDRSVLPCKTLILLITFLELFSFYNPAVESGLVRSAAALVYDWKIRSVPPHTFLSAAFCIPSSLSS